MNTHPLLQVIQFTDFPMEPLRGKNPFNLMSSGCAVLEHLGLKHWVSAGSALGLRREALGFIEHDTDVDVEVLLHWDGMENRAVRDAIVDGAEALGWVFIREMNIGGPDHPSQLAFIDPADNIIFDIYFFYDDVELGVLVNYNDWGILRQPARFFTELHTLTFGERVYPVPAPVDEYLEDRYGSDWMVPRAEKGPWNEDANNLVVPSELDGVPGANSGVWPEGSALPVVGYMDGTFDLFHFGHVNVLRQARSHCDALIVGVATDDLCRAGKRFEPIMSYAERSAVVDACRYVDHVVPHEALNESDMRRAQRMLGLKIGKHLMGEDYGCWGTEQDERLEWCNVQGIESVRLHRTPGISTSEIKQRFAARLDIDGR